MRERIIADVLGEMQQKLDNGQLTCLREVLIHCLRNYCVTEDINEDIEPEYIELFLSA